MANATSTIRQVVHRLRSEFTNLSQSIKIRCGIGETGRLQDLNFTRDATGVRRGVGHAAHPTGQHNAIAQSVIGHLRKSTVRTAIVRFDLTQLIRGVVGITDRTVGRIAAVRRHLDEIAIGVKAVIPRGRFDIDLGGLQVARYIVSVSDDASGSDRLLAPHQGSLYVEIDQSAAS